MPAEIKDRYEFEPIGLLHTGLRWRYEAPRQAGFSDAKARSIPAAASNRRWRTLPDSSAFGCSSSFT